MDTLTARFDFSGALERPEIQPDGSVIYTGRVARTGVHEYPWGVERRDASELARIATQLPGLPITAGHPRDGKLLVNGGQAERVGKILDAHVRGDHVVARMHLTSDGAAYVRAGMKELSLGYGTKPVNGWQTDTRSDHAALVFEGRCGASCSLRTDCKGDCAHAPSMEIQVQNLQLLGAF
jgi:hypothetical protein